MIDHNALTADIYTRVQTHIQGDAFVPDSARRDITLIVIDVLHEPARTAINVQETLHVESIRDWAYSCLVPDTFFYGRSVDDARQTCLTYLAAWRKSSDPPCLY